MNTLAIYIYYPAGTTHEQKMEFMFWAALFGSIVWIGLYFWLKKKG